MKKIINNMATDKRPFNKLPKRGSDYEAQYKITGS